MVEISAAVLQNFSIFLAAIFFFALLAKKIKLSPLVGYIVSGIFLGNFLQGVYSKAIINNFAYFGIILLLFTIGLEINFRRLLSLKKFIILGGTLQILVSFFCITLLALIFGFSPLVSFLIGIALSSSSTTIVAKIIQDKGEEGSFLGELALGILMFQDIAFIPFLIIFTSITSQTVSFIEVVPKIFFSLVKSTLIVAVLFYIGQKIIPFIFDRIAKTSRELLNFFVIFFIFFTIYLSTVFQIPTLIGVFIAGILIGQSPEHRHIFSQIRPIRDILAVIFFVFIGFNLNLVSISGFIPKILLFVGLVSLVKGLVVIFIALFLKFHSRTAFSLASYLFQIDEDAFILMSQAYLNKVIGLNDYSFIIGSIVITLIVTPILIQKKDQIYFSFRQLAKRYLPFLDNIIKYRFDQDRTPIDVLDLKDHIIICGYGRVGRYIGRALMLVDIPFVAVDYNFHVVEKAKKEGINIIYGDPTDIDILDYLEIEKARVLISVVPGRYNQETIILNAKKLNPKIVIFNRIHHEGDQQRMKDLGAEVVVQPEFEASLSIIRRILFWRGLDKEEIARKIKRLKIEHGMI